MSEDKNWFNKFSSFMDQNIRGIQYGVYCVAGLGLVIAIRSVRPFLKFTSPSDVPTHFMQKKMPFQAKVVGIQPSCGPGANPLVLVDHHPVLKLPFFTKKGVLPLEVSGVDITSNGFTWMQTMLVGNEIKFIPLRADDIRLHSIVLKKKQNVGHQLVSIGFASVGGLDMKLEKDPYYMKYYQGLLAEEHRAERKGAGIWAGTKPTFMQSIFRKLKNWTRFSHS